MLCLHHLWLSPACRAVRIALAEKKIAVVLDLVRVWERDPAFLAINPACEVPVLVIADGTPLCGLWAILHYLEDTADTPNLLGEQPLERAEVRRLMEWFDRKMAMEATTPLLDERVWKRCLGLGDPSSATIRAGQANLKTHLSYIGWLAERRNWLAGESISLADCVAAAHVSCLDYTAAISWEDYPLARVWYARIKSRPSMREILTETMPGLRPPSHYANPDF